MLPKQLRAVHIAAALLAGVVLTDVRVVDGDTIRADGVTYRIENIDTPETGSRARCPEERRMGNAATARARELILNARRVEAEPIGRRDRYGRTVARVRIDGRDFGERMIAEGLARRWDGARHPWCGS